MSDGTISLTFPSLLLSGLAEVRYPIMYLLQACTLQSDPVQFIRTRIRSPR